MKSTKINPINLITIFDGPLFTEGKLPSPKYECCNGFHIVSSDIFGVKIGWLLKPQSIFQVPKYSILEPSYLKIDKRLILEWVFDQFWFKRHQTKRYEKGYDIIEVFMKKTSVFQFSQDEEPPKKKLVISVNTLYLFLWSTLHDYCFDNTYSAVLCHKVI